VRVSAEVILRSRGGTSLTEGREQITAERIDEVRPDEGVKAAVGRAFEERGFTIHDSGITLTVEGEPELFERELGVKLDVNPHAPPGNPIASASGEPQVPEEVREFVETVVFPRRAHLFGSRARREENHGED
jgi:hypothetical protein